MVGVLSQHALQEGCYPSMHCRWYPSMPCRGVCSGRSAPGGFALFLPGPRGACSRGVSSWGVPAPGRGGGCLVETPGGLLLRAIHILLECILVSWFVFTEKGGMTVEERCHCTFSRV